MRKRTKKDAFGTREQEIGATCPNVFIWPPEHRPLMWGVRRCLADRSNYGRADVTGTTYESGRDICSLIHTPLNMRSLPGEVNLIINQVV